jgi:tetratricopeptide (TPR) repeat protein
MKTVILSAAIALIVTLGTTLALRGTGSERADPPGLERLTGRLDLLERKLGELAEAQGSLAGQVGELPAGSDSSGAAFSDQTRIEEAVARWIDDHQEELKGAGRPEPEDEDGAEEMAAAVKPPPARVDLPSTLAQLLDPRVTLDEKEGMWVSIRKAGLMDEALAALEKRAKENPLDPECHAEVGSAYLQKIEEAKTEIEKGTLAVKADKAFDAALAADPNHWPARFQKATALSFWPPIFGKKAEAIQHFELLVKQQDGAPARPEFAQTYLYLGNLYQEQGNHDQALATWKKGQALFPDEPEISERLKSAEGK